MSENLISYLTREIQKVLEKMFREEERDMTTQNEIYNMKQGELKFDINELQLQFMKVIACDPTKHFDVEVRKIFTIETICKMCGINRNRYNYLVRSGLIKFLYMDLRDEVRKQCQDQ